jgi:hypothetical protein
VFRWVVLVALAGFVIAFFLKEVPLRDSSRAGAGDMGDGFSAPDGADPDRQLERAVSRALRKAGPQAARHILAESGTRLTPGQAWALGQIHWRSRARGGTSVTEVAHAHHMPAEVLEPAFEGVSRAGYARLDEDRLSLTPDGHTEVERLTTAWRDWLESRLDGWDGDNPVNRAQLDGAVRRIADRLLDEEQTWREPADV